VVDGAVAEVSPLDVAVAHGAGVIVHVNPLVPLYNDRTTLCLPLDGGHCASLAEKGVGWIGEQALRMLLAAKLEDTLENLRARHPQLVIHRIEPGRHELPMLMQHMMSFGVRRELLEYGLQCGRRAVKRGVVRTLTHSGASTSKMCPE
jgi:hypothetical protein